MSRSIIAASAIVIGSVAMVAGVQTIASAAPKPKVQVCHTTPDHTNLITVNGNGLNGHLGNPGEQGHQPAPPDAVLVDGECVSPSTTIEPTTTTASTTTTTESTTTTTTANVLDAS